MHRLFPVVRPLLHAMDAETAHRATVQALKIGLYARTKTEDDERLNMRLWGLAFPNPVGIGAGFDKNAEALDGLFSFGLGFAEAGTVTPRAQAGNPRPRLFRDANTKSVINRMGFNNDGMDAFWDRYQRFRRKGIFRHGIVGINIGKNKDTESATADYETLIARFAPYADYLTINISSPNTPGLRNLQQREHLLPLLQTLMAAREKACQQMHQPPMLVKLAPDLTDSECEEIAQALLEAGIDGIILSNTTLDRPGALPAGFSAQAGGLSGPFVRDKSTAIISRFYSLTKGQIPIIGVGGIASGLDAYVKIRAGASLVQLYTALVFEGPALVSRIKRDLLALMDRDGFKTIADAVGK